jgi:uncharacterized protein with ParB-like and HNH nuclease domain
MKLDANDRTLRAILNTYFFFIPRFQRPYSWELEQVEELWEDAVQESGPDYFIGSMVVYPHREDTVAVIDGQQRLTTLMMLLCAIRDAAEANGDTKLANGTHTFVERTDENDEDRFVLNTETSFPYLHDEILSRDEAELDAHVGREELAIEAAYDRIKEYVGTIVEAVQIDPKLTAPKKKAKVSAELKSLRDKLLGLRLIFVEVGDQDAATTIFVTLNSRGKDLEPADLVKAHLLQLLPKSKHLDRPRLKWESIIDKFDASQTPLNMTEFLLAVWRSRYGPTTAKKLHKDVRREIKKPQAEAFLNDLVADAELFRRVNEPEYFKWTREGKQAASSLRFFRDFGIRQPMPLLLSLIREYDAKRITATQAARALRAIEDYHFTWTVLANKSSSGGMSLFFARFARELLQANDKNARGLVINRLCAELKARRPSAAEFDEAFGELWFTDNYTSEKRVIQYALARIYEHESPKTAVDFSHMTIEHLDPQPNGSNERGSIGNLILVTEALNGNLKSSSWDEKRKLLRKANDQWIPKDVKQAQAWGDDEIVARTAALAELGRTKVWKG